MLDAKGIDAGEFLEYKGRPLVRQGNDIYYGDLSDKYHIYMMIMQSKAPEKGNIESVPGTIMVQLLEKGAKSPEKQAISRGLADALETADAWLERYNK